MIGRRQSRVPYGGRPTSRSTAPLRPYLERGDDPVLQPPFQATGTRMFNFFFDADRQRLADYCDRWLNPAAPEGVEYVPLAGLVVLGFAQIACMRSVHERDSLQGWTPETDVGFWIPLARRRRVMGSWLIERICWTLCYVFVDSLHAAAIGREVWGFPKTLGRFQMPVRPEDEALFSVETRAIERFGRESCPADHRLLSVHRTDGGGLELPRSPSQARGQLFVLLGRAARAGLAVPGVPGPGALLSALRQVLVGHVPMVFLKQFRDAVDPSLACYQEVVEAPAQLTRFSSGGFLPGRYELELMHLDSLPIASDLGIEDGAQALAAVELDFDFIMHQARASR